MILIQKFNDYSGIIEAGSGYGDVSRIDRDHLIELATRLPPGDIILTTAPHDKGRAVLMKPGSEKRPWWHTLAPIKAKRAKKEDDEQILFRVRK
jgi:hypothetical protein